MASDFRWHIALGVTAALVASSGYAQNLPIKVYTTADGLASSAIQDIVADSRGFLWFATRDGLSRFDGTGFRTYTSDDGLSNPVVNTILPTRDGEYWVATNGGGVCRLNLDVRASPPLFTCRDVGDRFYSNRVNALIEDRQRRIWLATDRGVFRINRDGDEWWPVPIALQGNPIFETIATPRLYEDSAGRIWVGFTGGLIRLDLDGRVGFYVVRGITVHDVQDIVEHDGQLAIALRIGVLRFRPEERAPTSTQLNPTVLDPKPCLRDATPRRSPSVSPEACLVTAGDGLPHTTVSSLRPTPDGRLWIGTFGGLAYLHANSVTNVAVPARLAAGGLSALTHDTAGQLWIGTQTGAVRLIIDSFVSYGPDHGLGHPRVRTLLEDRDGTVFAITPQWIVSQFDGRRFHATQAWRAPGASFTYYTDGAFLDRADRWWLLTDRGLYRLPRGVGRAHGASQRPEAVYTTNNGLPNNRVDGVFEDSRGDLWIITRHNGSDFNLSRWRRETNEIQVFREGFGTEHQFPIAITEDREGAVWVGFESGGLARYHEKRFTVFGTADGVPPSVTALHVDSRGALWIASASAGVSVLRDVKAKQLRFERYSKAEGLASNNVQCLTEDRWGRIYLGTSRGVDRLDPSTGRVRYFGTADGLAADYVTAALRDRTGALWFGTHEGVSRLVPVLDQPSSAPPVRIGEVRIGGVLQPISEFGVEAISDLRLEAGQNHLQVAFFGIAFGREAPLIYRYRLEGAESKWTGPVAQNVVHYASLSSGRYRFVVEAMNPDGVASMRPASVAFVVMPPLWQRSWFIAVAIGAVAGLAFVLHRVRVGRILAVERLRTRIAADLHDDIGGTLSRIAIQSEVARRDLLEPAGASARRLVEIGDTARAVVESLADVVWSVDPVQDDLASVERRVREYAADVLGPRGVRWTFHGTGHLDRFALGPDARRDLLLLLKEGITNVARHAEANVASLHLRVVNGALHAELRDDGCGFDAAALASAGEMQGHGIANMRMRAQQLHGEITVESTPGAGTHLNLVVPLSTRRRINMRLWPVRL